MSDLEPVTREEKLLDGQELEPITRKEMFIKRIYDKTQTIPEPVTREEYFLKKAGEGGGGDVTIEQLNVSENGTYSEEGKAYSPVVVNVPSAVLGSLSVTSNGTYTPPSGVDGYSEVNVDVPLPQNALLLKDIPSTPTAIATFSDGAEMVMPSLKVAIEPVQEGSGDPSPENVRPISGWDEVNITVADDDTDPTISNVYTIDLDGTRYGGTLDVVSGVLTVDRAMMTYDGSSDENWVDNMFQYGYSIEKGSLKSNVEGKSNYLKYSFGGTSDGSYYIGSSYLNVRIDSITSLADFKTYLASNPLQICSELATPLTIQLTPTAVKSLEGDNNLYADSGEILEGEYLGGVS